MTTSCERLDEDLCRMREQAKRDLTYAVIVILGFVIGIGVVVGAVGVARPILLALLQAA